MPLSQHDGTTVPSYVNAVYPPGYEWVGVWNWGAFLLTPFWLLNHGRPKRGIIALVCGVMVPCWPIALAMAITYGVIGNGVAIHSRAFKDSRQFVAVQNAWRTWGFAYAGIMLTFLGLMILESFLHPTPAPK